MMRVEHLFISPGHNFFGHHGQPAGGNPVSELDEVECVAGRGIRGDRFFEYKEDYKGQITFFSMEVFEALRRELNLPDAQPGAPRRNAVVRGADLSSLIGKEFAIQGLKFAGVEECKAVSLDELRAWSGRRRLAPGPRRPARARSNQRRSPARRMNFQPPCRH